jgi:pyruvate,water dikinase
MNQYLANLNDVGINDIETVGGKNASLGEMLQNLHKLGIKIPNGFVITAHSAGILTIYLLKKQLL